MLQTHDFMKIPNWAYDEHSFTLIVLGNGGATRLLFETSVVCVILNLFFDFVVVARF